MRYYDPGIARFMGRDMFARAAALGKISPEELIARGIQPAIGPYVYVGNNPIGAVDPRGLRTVHIRITVDDALVKASKRRGMPLDPDKVGKKLQELLDQCFDPCQKSGRKDYAKKDEVKVDVNVSESKPGQLGLAEGGWQGYVTSGRPVAGGRAMTGRGGTTVVRLTLIEQDVAAVPDPAGWDQIWSNILAHEQIWLGAMGRRDAVVGKGAEEGDIRSPTGTAGGPARIPEKVCRELGKKLGVE